MQFVVFVGLVVMTVRWVSADCRVTHGRAVTFPQLAIASIVTSVVVPVTLRVLSRSSGLQI